MFQIDWERYLGSEWRDYYIKPLTIASNSNLIAFDCSQEKRDHFFSIFDTKQYEKLKELRDLISSYDILINAFLYLGLYYSNGVWYSKNKNKYDSSVNIPSDIEMIVANFSNATNDEITKKYNLAINSAHNVINKYINEDVNKIPDNKISDVNKIEDTEYTILLKNIDNAKITSKEASTWKSIIMSIALSYTELKLDIDNIEAELGKDIYTNKSYLMNEHTHVIYFNGELESYPIKPENFKVYVNNEHSNLKEQSSFTLKAQVIKPPRMLSDQYQL